LQTLVQRLEYGRQQASRFWQKELEILRQAMGWSKAPTIQFDNMILKDESAEKALLIQLLDRNLISEELVVEMFGAIPELENARKKREKRERDSGKRAQKSGPYDKDKIHDLVKIALGRGFISPEQAGIDIDDFDSETPFDKQMENSKPKSIEGPNEKDGPTGKSGEGRPKNSKDDSSIERDRKFKPRTSAEVADDIGKFLNDMSWVKNAQSSISGIIAEAILKHYKKKNMRSLSLSQSLEVENVKFRVLSNVPKNAIINESLVSEILSKNSKVPTLFKKCYNALIQSHTKNVKRQPTIEELRNIQAATYCLCS